MTNFVKKSRCFARSWQGGGRTDYRRHVQECQPLLRGARSAEERQMLVNMADTWEALAVSREKKLKKVWVGS